jgi:hypothetical protein
MGASPSLIVMVFATLSQLSRNWTDVAEGFSSGIASRKCHPLSPIPLIYQLLFKLDGIRRSYGLEPHFFEKKGSRILTIRLKDISKQLGSEVSSKYLFGVYVMVSFQRCSARASVNRLLPFLMKAGVSLCGLSAFLTATPSAAQCCGQAITAPVVSQSYRLDYQTVYDEQQMTAYRMTYETVYDTKTYTVQKPVWETETRERRYTVQRPVWETQNREERYTVMKPVYETVVQDRSYNVVRDVVETSTREERYTVMKPVYETSVQQRVSTVRRPVYETSERQEAYTVAEPVTSMRTAYSVSSTPVDTVTPVVTPGYTSLGWQPRVSYFNPYTGVTSWRRGGLGWNVTPSIVVNQVNRVYQPTVTPVQVPQTTYVNRVFTRKVPVQTVRYVDEQVVQQFPVQTLKMVPEVQVRQVPVQTVRKVVERVENKVPVQVCKYVAEEQVRQVPVQVLKYVAEQRVEPISVQVCKYVAEQRTAQIPRVVAKQIPYSYVVRKPRTVVTRVPLDPCGNPLPIAQGVAPVPALPPATTPPMTPANSTAPTLAPATQAPATQAPVPGNGPIKTFSDRPTDVPPSSNEGWKDSELNHVNPETGSSASEGKPIQANRPTGDIDQKIPTPAEPTPAAGTSLKLQPIPAPPTTHTT